MTIKLFIKVNITQKLNTKLTRILLQSEAPNHADLYIKLEDGFDLDECDYLEKLCLETSRDPTSLKLNDEELKNIQTHKLLEHYHGLLTSRKLATQLISDYIFLMEDDVIICTEDPLIEFRLFKDLMEDHWPLNLWPEPYVIQPTTLEAYTLYESTAACTYKGVLTGRRNVKDALNNLLNKGLLEPLPI